MKRVTLTLIVVAVICAAGYYVLTHPNLEQIERLSDELQDLRAQNQELANRNSDLEEKIMALRDDPRLAERRARESVGLAKPGEVVFQFEEPEQTLHVRVRLRAGNERLELAGEKVTVEALGAQLSLVRRQIAGASLVVIFDDDIGPIERQRIVDVVEASELAPAIYEDQ